jgi:hypothetical protein
MKPVVPAMTRAGDWLLAGALLLAASSASAADIRRTADGRPDLSGVWQTLSPADRDLLPHAARKDAPANLGVVEGGEIPYQPWAAAKKADNFAKRETADPSGKCFMPGVPRVNYAPYPFQIFQSARGVTVLYEYAHSVRQIYTNGSRHPDGHIDWWLGDSRGHWEGDSLVVDVVDFNDETWLSHAGDFHSDQLHVVERYTPIDADHIRYEATLEDPKVFTRPWKIGLVLYRRIEPGVQLLENDCYAFDYERFYP